MNRNLILAIGLIVGMPICAVRADIVLDWNETLRLAAQTDGQNPVNKANPGWLTRTMAMTNGAIYDVFQSFDRTHAPFLVNRTDVDPANTSLEAAVHSAAYEVMLHCYPGQSATLLPVYNQRLGDVVASAGQIGNGVLLGQQIAQAYIAARAGDNADAIKPYTPGTQPGQWRPDPLHLTQEAWGPGWGTVQTFAVPHNHVQNFIAGLPGIPDMNSAAYTAAFEEVRDIGELNSATRTPEQTEIGVFWGYDRATMGPPPVLFLRNMHDIATQSGNTEAENARLFAQASVAMADAAIAAWDAKFEYDFWRPVAAIREAGDGTVGDNDGNPNTVAVPDWRPLGAPGDPLVADSDFTPPFPAWPSGHATMAGAMFETLRLFYGTNVFGEIEGVSGSVYNLTSQEMMPSDLPDAMLPPGYDNARQFTTFSAMLDSATPDYTSPEWENAISRIYLGIHWIFDATDGISLGNAIAGELHGNHFQAVPEPASVALALWAIGLMAANARRRR